MKVSLRKISNALRECTLRKKKAAKAGDQNLWEYWAAKREGVQWARQIIKWELKNEK